MRRASDGPDGHDGVSLNPVEAVTVCLIGAPSHVVDDLPFAYDAIPMAERPHPICVPYLQRFREILIRREIGGYYPFEMLQDIVCFPRVIPDSASDSIEALVILIEADEGIAEIIVIFPYLLIVDRLGLAVGYDLRWDCKRRGRARWNVVLCKIRTIDHEGVPDVFAALSGLFLF